MKQGLKQVLKIIAGVISGFFTAVFFVFYVEKKQQRIEIEKTPDQIKKEAEEKLEKTTPDDLVANSPDPDLHKIRIEGHQNEFRQRVRDRLRK